jgi:RNA recognition motif-containing protein
MGARTWCRGFGTVRFETPEEAQAAVEAMNNTEIDGRVITVRIDRYG